MLYLFSVGGGSEEKEISVNLVNCIKLANERAQKYLALSVEMAVLQKNLVTWWL